MTVPDDHALTLPVPPGSGWPGDPATPQTPVAADAGQVRDLAAGAGSLAELVARQSVCRACPRLVEWREHVAAVKRASSRTERYWGRPIPGWGDERPRVLILGLAPAANGGNRTGRVFTGDRSGDVLFASLYRCGLAAQPTSTAAGDGQRLIGARMVAAVRCAPPDNKPSVTERDTCAPWLAAEFGYVAGSVKVIVCLGGFAWQAAWTMLRSAGYALPRPRPAFGHGAEVSLPAPASGTGVHADRAGPAPGGPVLLLGCYHPSQQNTFTGRVTPPMLDEVFQRARTVAGLRQDSLPLGIRPVITGPILSGRPCPAPSGARTACRGGERAIVHGGGRRWCVVMGRRHCGRLTARMARPECGYAECAMYTKIG